MKKLLFGLSLLLLTSCKMTSRYEIHSNHSTYFTSSYTKSADGCITFKDNCGCATDKTVTLCGTYDIVERTAKRKKY